MKIQNKAPMLLAVCLSALLVAGCHSQAERQTALQNKFPDADVRVVPDTDNTFLVVDGERILYAKARPMFLDVGPEVHWEIVTIAGCN